MTMYGTCQRGADCWHGKGGCLRQGWKGMGCPHWNPVQGEQFNLIMKYLEKENST